MNRDGEGPGTPPEGEPPTDGTEDRAADNVIQFPGARLRAAPPPEPTPELPAGSADTPATDTGEAEPGMTLDAFERAVRSAVRDKLGEGAPQGADELVAQVFSALTGKDAKTALAEVRQRLSEPAIPAAEASEGDVIDLSAVRDARQRASLESARQIGGALKDSFAQFIAGLARRQGVGGEITLDANFFRQHGPSLLGNLFQGLASALMQQARPPAPPAAPPSADTAQAAPPSADTAPVAPPTAPNERDGSNGTPPETAAAAPVQVKLDIGSILAGLFRRRDTPPPDGKPPGPR